jgi:glucosamine--fructose-6-phosphate aminotransferase (isomerizing)
MNQQLADILNQPRSLARVLEHQFGYGNSALRNAAATLRDARNIVFTGMGSSLFASIPAALLLTSTGRVVEAVDSSELLYYRRALLQPGTVVVLVSRSGDSIEITKLLPVVRAAGARAVGVTNTPDSTLGRELPDRILVGHDPDQIVAIQSYTAAVVVLLLLALETAERMVGSQQMGPLVPAFQQTIDDEFRRMSDWPDFLSQARAVYLLGRGPSMASVYEGALLFNEAARTPSVAMSAAQFRHGPVEIVDAGFRAIVFASEPATAELDRTLAQDLQRLGAGVRTCSAAPELSPFHTAVEIIPVQFAACALSQAKGIPSGEFRYSGQVTTAETGFRAL